MIASSVFSGHLATAQADLTHAGRPSQVLKADAFRVLRDRDQIEIRHGDDLLVSFRAAHMIVSIALHEGILAVSTRGPGGDEVSLHRLHDGRPIARLLL